jgi:hypothetical protein
MPTLPTHSLFDKDLSLRSPFPLHVLAPRPQRPPVIGFVHPGTVAANAAPIKAPRDFSQMTRPIPSKAKSHSVFDLTFGPNEKPESSKSIFRPPVSSQSPLGDAHLAGRVTISAISGKGFRSNAPCKPGAKSNSHIRITLLTV